MTSPADLRALALKATPGPYFLAYNKVVSEPVSREYDRLERDIPADAPDDDSRWAALPEPFVAYVDTAAGDTPSAKGLRDGEYLAAVSPDVVLALLDENERLRAELAEYRAAARVCPSCAFEYAHESDGLAAINALRAELARMRGIVEAAKAFVALYNDDADPDGPRMARARLDLLRTVGRAAIDSASAEGAGEP